MTKETEKLNERVKKLELALDKNEKDWAYVFSEIKDIKKDISDIKNSIGESGGASGGYGTSDENDPENIAG
ncbi:TPA_asm: DNA gyrase/topoisomerase [Altiarchaeum virus]|nr:MAG: hypothetical protein BWK75_06460 [Candidatus Altiarchaeales archaeon A3]DAZ85555.1 TPA_asm: DNA gyrase/topoisomerase [Altiarchaeum virus]